MPSEFGSIDKSISNELIKHVKDSTFYIKNPHISQCIDGRRTKNESNFGISIPGGGLGQLAVMLSVLEETIISKKTNFRAEALKIFFDVIGGKENLSFHTDEHCDGKCIGCGHITLLLEKEAREMYGLSDESLEFIQNIISEYKKDAIFNTLKGNHAEKGILKVYSTHHSVHANHNGEQYFIYTPKLSYIRNKEIARKIYKDFIEGTSISITVDSLTEMLQRKMDLNFQHTIHTLAPDLPIYRVKHSLSGKIKLFNKIAEKSKDLCILKSDSSI